MAKDNQVLSANNPGGVMEAAGGVLVKNYRGKTQIALVHRPRYDDWTFPKGGREPGESWPDTAKREVFEETNCQVGIINFIGCNCYQVEGNPKIVLYWQMHLIEEGEFNSSGETDRLKWLTFHKAYKKLSYESDRQLLEMWEKNAE